MTDEKNGNELFVRSWIPAYAAGEKVYSPRVIGHLESSALSDKALLALFEEGARAGRLDRDGPDVCEEFEALLEEHGYRVFRLTDHAQGMFVAPAEH